MFENFVKCLLVSLITEKCININYLVIQLMTLLKKYIFLLLKTLRLKKLKFSMTKFIFSFSTKMSSKIYTLVHPRRRKKFELSFKKNILN